MEKAVIIIGAIGLVFGVSLLGNLIMTPLVNWVIHLFKSDIVLTYWQVYGLSFVISLLFGGFNRGRSSN